MKIKQARSDWALSMIRFVVIALLIGLAACTRGPESQTRAAQYTVEGRQGGGGKAHQDNRFMAERVLTEALRDDGIHDPQNPAIDTLQEPRDAMANFPMDRRGGVNWVEALDKGMIKPRQSVDGKEEMLIMNMDILFKDTGEMPWVKFPHLAHTRWLDCSNCHPNIFVPQQGANNPSMDGILAGEHCGRCHDKVAFSLWICERCHNTPHEGSPAKWWK